MLRAVSRINAAVRRGMPAETLEALTDPAAQLPDVYPLAAPLYQHQLSLLQRQHPRVRAPQGQAGSSGSWDPLGSVPLLGWGYGGVSVCLPHTGRAGAGGAVRGRGDAFGRGAG